MNINWKAKICSGMDVVEKINFIKEGVDSNGKKYTANSVYVPSADEQYKTRDEWLQSEIDAIADKLSDDLDESIIAQSKFQF
mgnify:FL=1|tara:strand:+ start:224 stop:469 length:246 start_codon:yes stop_codon:yes gene_type:complete